MSGNLEELSKLLICPDCRSSVISIKNNDDSIVAFVCLGCDLVFPIKDCIPIMLAKTARNYSLEHPLISTLSEICHSLSEDARNAIRNTNNLLLASRNRSATWEWEDEVFWSAEYRHRRTNRIEKNWNDRNWERELLISELLKRIRLKGKTILSIGAGEGNNFKELLLPHCNEKTLYIAIDISYEALISNRLTNPHSNSFFILASADYCLPIKQRVVDVLCYFGILHHTKNKTDNIPKHLVLVRDAGFILLAESLHRPTLSIAKITERKEHRSAHEEHLQISAVTYTLSKTDMLKTIVHYEFGTILLTAVKYALGSLILRSRALYQALLKTDILIASRFGKYLGFLKGGSILLLVEVSRNAHM